MAAAGARTGAAFGLAISGDVPVLGLEPAEGTASRPVVLRRLARSAIESAYPRGEGSRVGGVGSGRGAVNVLSYGERGYVWRAPRYGLYRVSADGRAIDCAPVRSATWWWQRMLVGQALPHAALSHGLEVLHAGVVGVAGGAIALTGDSGLGKSTLVAALVAQGAAFLADDVAALEPVGEDDVLAHPGPAVMSLRRPAPEGLVSVGTAIGGDEHETRLRVARGAGPLPLRALVVLARSSGGGKPRLEPLDPGDPRPLLAATFNRAIRDPERLARQLDVCARIAGSAKVVRLGVSRDVAPSVIARAIAELA